MAKLVLKAGTGPQVIELDDLPTTIGRHPANRLVLDDIFASARHATLSPLGRRYVLEDHHSANGTRVNGERLAKARPLKPGDLIAIGKAQYEFVDGAQAEARAAAPPAAAAAPPKPVPPAKPAAPARPAAPPAPAAPPPSQSAMARRRPPSQSAFEDPEMWRMEATQILSAELLPMGPKAVEAPRSTPVEFELRLPDDTKGAAVSPQNVDLEKLAAENPEMLDALVGSIKSKREQEQREVDEKRAKLIDQWCKVVAYAERLKAKVAADPRVKVFQISGRNNDITIRIQRSAEARVELLYFSFAHPDHKPQAQSGIWLRRTGAADVCFPSAEVATRELVRHMAVFFAAN